MYRCNIYIHTYTSSYIDTYARSVYVRIKITIYHLPCRPLHVDALLDICFQFLHLIVNKQKKGIGEREIERGLFVRRRRTRIMTANKNEINKTSKGAMGRREKGVEPRRSKYNATIL